MRCRRCADGAGSWRPLGVRKWGRDATILRDRVRDGFGDLVQELVQGEQGPARVAAGARVAQESPRDVE